MASDVQLSHELKALQDELSAAQRSREQSTPPPGAGDAGKAAAAEPPEDAANTDELRKELGEFVDTMTALFEEAEKNVAAHPVASVMGALVVGILIGRLLGRK